MCDLFINGKSKLIIYIKLGGFVMSKIIGIDLGIINFCVVVMEGGELKVILNLEGNCIIFFVVVFKNEEC